MHDAIKVANYILSFSENQLNNPITNLQLQKILYYVQGMSLRLFKKQMFSNEIEAWRYGPVIPDVYYWFNNNSSDAITGVSSEINDFMPQEIELINQVVTQLVYIDPWDLVRKTHSEEPWKKNYYPGVNNKISEYDMEEYFCK